MGNSLLRFCGTAILAVVLNMGAGIPACAQQAAVEASPQWGASLGVVTVPEHSLYQGRLYLQAGGLVNGATYEERAHSMVGMRVGVRFRALSGTRVGLTLYGMRGTSTGDYTGISGPERATRTLEIAGADAGWQPAILETGTWSIQVPVGPSLAWQKLHLSDGHRDAYATPAGGETEEVDWSDRAWTSIGGHVGMAVNVRATSHLNLFLTGRGRFLFNRGSGSWGDRERADILRSTGNSVSITYTDRVVLQSAIDAGLEWRP